MKTEIKEFIKEQHAEACSERKVKIEEKYPELFKSEIEIGKWYKDTTSEIILFVEKVFSDKIIGYGTSYVSEWNNPGTIYFGSNMDEANKVLTPAADNEVETALIAEAKRRGFKKGVNFINTAGRKVNCFNILEVYVDYNKNWGACYGDGNGLIFHNGKWATIIEEEAELNVIEKLNKIVNKHENKINKILELQKKEIQQILNEL